jgi:transposase
MALTWYANQSDCESCRFGALAVIAPLMERMNIAQIINHHLPADPQAELDYGTTLSVLMAARLYSPLALRNVAAWVEESGADILWNIPPAKMNDDRLGRALDAFFEQRHSILALCMCVASSACHCRTSITIRRTCYSPASTRKLKLAKG